VELGFRLRVLACPALSTWLVSGRALAGGWSGVSDGGGWAGGGVQGEPVLGPGPVFGQVGTQTRCVRSVAPRALAWKALVRLPAARSRLWARAAQTAQAALASKCPEGRCASGGVDEVGEDCFDACASSEAAPRAEPALLPRSRIAAIIGAARDVEIVGTSGDRPRSKS
jgi:hypothetical protein